MATVTSPGHLFVTGELVAISGAGQPEYNGTFTITVLDANTFTYTVAGTPATPATGATITATLAPASPATGTTLTANGAPASPATGSPLTATDFPASPATGTMTVAGSAPSPATGTVTLTKGSLTRNGTTATMVMPNHGYINGETVTVSGANQPEYNGTFVISNVTPTTFDYTITGSPALAATGTITVQSASLATGRTVGGITLHRLDGDGDHAGPRLFRRHVDHDQRRRSAAIRRRLYDQRQACDGREHHLSSSTATVTLPNHGYVTGQLVTITGAGQPEYNGTFTITVIDANTFTYAVSDTPLSPATGTIIVSDDTTFSYTVAGTPASPATGVITAARRTPSSVTRNGSKVTVTLVNNGFVTGQTVLISGAAQAEYNGTFKITVTPQQRTATSITRSGSTATVTLANHGYVTGQVVTISGADQSQYDVSNVTITVIDANTFSYTVTDSPVSPATGAIIVTDSNTFTYNIPLRSISSITRVGGTATVTAIGHGFYTGESVTISGASPAQYNGTFTITVTGPNTFTYIVSGTPASPATGTMTATGAGRQSGDGDDFGAALCGLRQRDPGDHLAAGPRFFHGGFDHRQRRQPGAVQRHLYDHGRQRRHLHLHRLTPRPRPRPVERRPPR